jgi:hypothetical protein
MTKDETEGEPMSLKLIKDIIENLDLASSTERGGHTPEGDIRR